MRKKQVKQKILIVRPDSIGDVVLFLRSIKGLKKYAGCVSTSMLVQDHIVDLVKTHPDIDQVIGVNKSLFTKNRRYSKTFMQRLNQHTYDLVIHPVYSREMLGDFITLNCGAHKTIAIDGDNSNSDRRIKKSNDKKYDHLIVIPQTIKLEEKRNEYFIKKVFGCTHTKGDNNDVNLFLPTSDTQKVKDLCRMYGLSKDFMVIAPFAQDSFREWPNALWKKLLRQYTQHDIVMYGATNEKDKAAVFKKEIGHERLHDLTGKISLRECAALIKKTKVFIGMESGLCHIARAVNVPTVVIAGGGHAGRFVSPHIGYYVISRKMNCAGCCWNCRYDYPRCIYSISVTQVVNALRKIGIKNERAEKKMPSYLLASWYESIGELEVAKRLFLNCIEKSQPTQYRAGAYFHLGYIMIKEKNFKKALMYFKLCLSIDLHHKEAARLEKILTQST